MSSSAKSANVVTRSILFLGARASRRGATRPYGVSVPALDVTAPADRGPAARREQVRRRVLGAGFARLEDLAREFEVSAMTMHRDLDALEAEGWLVKIRGGATANPSALVDAGVRERSTAMRAEKMAISELAARMINHGQTIFLDDSTTALGLVPAILATPPITLATNFLPVVAAVGDAPDIDLHLLGGQYHGSQESCMGLQTVDAIGRFRADLFFMSTTAVSAGKCLHRSEPTVAVRQAFMHNANRSVLLVDHAKFGRSAPHLLCSLDRFDTIVTDDGIDTQELADLRARCSDVQVATVAG